MQRFVASVASRSLRVGAVVRRCFSTAAPKPAAPTASPATGKKSGGGIGVGTIVGGLVGGVVLATVGAVYGAPDWTLKQIIGIAKPKIKDGADVDLSFDDVKGSLSLFPPSADITFKKLKVVRPVIPGKLQSAFDLTMDSFRVRAGLGVRNSVPTVDTVLVDGMNGSFIRHPDSPPLPAVFFSEFGVANANLAVSTVGGTEASSVPVSLTKFHTNGAPLGLHTLPLSLSQCTLQGTIAKRPFVLRPLSGQLTHGAQGEWSIAALPLNVLAPLAPLGSPLEWIGGGTTDVKVTVTYDKPHSDKPYTLRMSNAFSIEDVRAAVPKPAPSSSSSDATAAAKAALVSAAATPVVAYLNTYSGGRRLAVGPLQYGFSQSQIEAVVKDPELAHIVKFFVTDLGNQLAAKAKGDVTETATKAASAGWSALSGWLSAKEAEATAAATAAVHAAKDAAGNANALPVATPVTPPLKKNSADSVD